MAEAVLRPGDRYAGNEVVRLLGAGGFAEVYEVRDPTGAPRALKILDADAEARPKLRARLAQEGAALTLLHHVNVVRLFDAGMAEERVYLLLELVHGKSLREVLHAHGGRPPVEAAVRWIRQAAEGVAEAHRRGIIHRDLKPENLLVTREEVVKVIDFGIAKLHGLGIRTSAEQQLGTALYMSPEQIRGAVPDPRMDVYALGLILYEAVAGAHPIAPAPASVFQICALQLGHRPRPLIEVAPAIPPELAAAADRALEKDPALRWPDVRAFADALDAALGRLVDDRLAALRRIAAMPTAAPQSSGPRGAPTQAMSVTGTAPTQPLSPPARTEPLPPPPARAGRRPDPVAIVVVVAAIGLGLACGAWLVLRVIPWPF
jgi:serine/threonine-protein kinase